MKRIFNAGLLAAGLWILPAPAAGQEDEHHASGSGFESTRFAGWCRIAHGFTVFIPFCWRTVFSPSHT